MNKRNDDMAYVFRPIGILKTPYKSKSGVPIQGVFDRESGGEAEIFEEYAPGLQDIEGFSHLIVIYVFHLSQGYDLVCKPYMEEKRHGVFAIRTPRRPNPIGFSVVRLLKKADRILYLSEVDMLNGTPILDIKPFVPRFDHRPDARVGWMQGTFRDEKYRKVSDDRF
jgi:tRNA-Thr(GGU) m(6)t(6)A37 methyltransferase TsaA